MDDIGLLPCYYEMMPSFNPCGPSFGCAFVWIRFMGLNVLYYDISALHTIALAISKPMKFDVTMQHVEKGNFRRSVRRGGSLIDNYS